MDGLVAIDAVNMTSTAYSSAFFVDKSPPSILNGAIDMSSAFLSPEQFITFSWIQAFFDAQSGRSLVLQIKCSD